MNVFMPCDNIRESVEALDDKRLIKQILECKQILEANERVFNGEQKVGYANHPVVKHYRDLGLVGMYFLVCYATRCCNEYRFRFGALHDFARDLVQPYIIMRYRLMEEAPNGGGYPPIIYAEGSINSPDYIRETNNEKVFELFKQKLIKKWDNDKYPPKWTNRGKPSWYKGEGK